MKTKFRNLFLLLVGVAFITACKKSSSSSSDPQLTPQQVSSQVALNISASLYGGLGAINVSGGLNAPQSFAVHSQGKVVNDVSTSGCGLTVDTTFKSTVTVGDSVATVSGTINLALTCTNSVLSGYTTNDNLSISLVSPQISFAYKVAENLTLLSLNPYDDASTLSLNGSLSSSGSYQLKTGTKRSGSQLFNYTFTSVIIDPNVGNIVSGKATFTTSGTGPKGVWSYQGTITFLANNQATVTINSKTYNVNLLTGIVS